MIYLGIRAFGVLVLAVLGNGSPVDRLTAWDGRWYLEIAASGYDLPPVPDAEGYLNPFTPRAFFPGFPVVIRWISGACGLSQTTVAILVPAVAGVVAAYGLARLGRIVRGGSRRAGYLLVALFAAAPMGVVLSMAYTEALFCALAVWALIGVLERRWHLAGICCAFAGLVRSSALALVLAVALAALVSLPRERRGPAVALLLAPLGLVGYLWWTGLRVHPEAGFAERLGTWSDLERQGWSTRFDGGVATTRFLWQSLTSPDAMTVLTVAVLLGYLVLLAVALSRRLEWPLVTYGGAIVVMALASSGLMHSKPRLLLPAFTLLVPVALGLANRRRSSAVWTVAGVAAVSAWFGAYALSVWKYAI
ncbi:hypothetical protein HFP15_20740 [Amycolatopsis sp. K13G38]|uniref:Glycosyltransferase RgtA/B/C/D-like domain-containing protein n=1 Tax=Amycolatopsis acididurans TaxID=2724524 RepID=A0ABX1J6A2_9PSEU|nr:hypothetical protein [Amycolatopsis acididurans]